MAPDETKPEVEPHHVYEAMEEIRRLYRWAPYRPSYYSNAIRPLTRRALSSSAAPYRRILGTVVVQVKQFRNRGRSLLGLHQYSNRVGTFG